MENNIEFTASSGQRTNSNYQNLISQARKYTDPEKYVNSNYDPSEQLVLPYYEGEEQSTKLSKKYESLSPLQKFVSDVETDFAQSFIQNFIEINAGNALMSQNEKTDLLFQKQYLENYRDFNRSRSRLANAMASGNKDEVDKAYEEHSIYRRIDEEMRPEYLKIIGETDSQSNHYTISKDIAGTIGVVNDPNIFYSDEEVENRIEKINNRLSKVEENIKTDQDDLQFWRNGLNKLNSIYMPSPDWQKKKQENILYQVPAAVASSIPSVIQAVGAYGAAWLLSTAGAYLGAHVGHPVAGARLGYALGMSLNTAQALYSRNQESLAEVSGAYKSKVYDYLTENELPLSAVTNDEVRQKLQLLSGYDYSNATDEQVLEGMMAYDIQTDDQNLNSIVNSSKNHLNDVYNRNMALVGADVAANFLMIPGYGKFISKALKTTNVGETTADLTYKALDKSIQYIAAKAGASTARKKAIAGSMKYVVEPVFRLGSSAAIEGGEEVAQYMISKDPSSEDRDWYNPFDFIDLSLENSYALAKGMAGVLGISGDPALNSDKELSDNFKIGTLVGLLMGGPAQIRESTRNYAGYRHGKDLGRQMMADHIIAKEDMYKYIQYGIRANAKMSDKRALFDGIDSQINENFLPEGWTKEDLEQEKRNINDIYDLIQNNDYVKSFKHSDRPIVAALMKHGDDVLNKMQKSYDSIDTPEFRNKVTSAVDKVAKKIGITSAEDKNLLTDYYLNKYAYQAIDSYIKQVKAGKKQLPDSALKQTNELLDDLYIERAELQRVKNTAEKILKDKKLFDKAKSNSLRGVASEIKDKKLENFIAGRELRKTYQYYANLSDNKEDMQAAVDKYKQSVKDNQDQDNALKTGNDNQQQQQEDVKDDNTAAQETPEVEVTTDKPINEAKPVTEQKTDDKADKQSTNPTPESTVDTPPIPNTEDKSSSKKINLTNFATEDPYEDYEDYRDDRLGDDDYANEELESASNSNNPSNNESNTDENYSGETNDAPQNADNQEPDSNTENEQPASQPKKTSLTDFSTYDSEEQEASNIPVTPQDEPVNQEPEVNDKTPKEYKDKLEEGNADLPSEEPDKTLVEGTLYYLDSDTPMMKGYESGKSFNIFSSTPGNIQSSFIEAIVDSPDSKYGKYNPQDKSTWDNAAVYVTFTAPDGKKYITALKTIDGAKKLKISKVQTLSAQEEDNLRTLRNTIIEAKLRNPNCTITFANVTQTNGQLNVNRKEVEIKGIIYNAAVNRNLQDIKGLGLPSDLHGLLDGEIAFAIGKGVRNNFKLEIIHNDAGIAYELNQSINSQQVRGGYGNIFIIPAASSNPSGLQNSVIKLNEKRFSEEDESLIDLAAQTVLYSTTTEGYPTDPLKKILIFTNWEKINPDDPRFELMAGKQIKLFTQDGEQMIQLGTEVGFLNSLRNPQGLQKVKNFIRANSHWSMDFDGLQTPMRDLFTDYFKSHYANLDLNTIPDAIELAKGFTITLKDLGLQKVDNFRNPLKPIEGDNGYTVLEWLIKNNKIQSDLQDQIYTSPFVYVSGPIINDNPTNTEQQLKTAAEDPVKPTPSSPSSTTSESTESAPAESTSQEVQDQIDELFGADGMSVEDLFKNTGAYKIENQNQLKKFKRINTVKAIKWLKSKLGLTDEQVIITEGVIRQFANGSAVYGVCNTDCINISDMAIEGVQYHEAWHRVSLLMLTPEMRQNLYSEYRKQHPEYKYVPDKQLEEALADRFMEYMLNDKQSTLRYYISKVFRDILRFIGINKGINPSNLNSIFEAIKYGDFAHYKLDSASIKEFNDAYLGQGANYMIGKNNDYQPTHFPTLADFHTTEHSLLSCLLISNGTKYISDINKLDKTKLLNMLKGIVNNARTTTQQKESIQEIIDNFDQWMYEMQPLLNQLGITEVQQNEDSDFQDRETTGILNYDKADYEFNKKDNALGVVKLFLSTIPEYYYDYVKKPDGSVDKLLKMRKDPITGLPKVMDYDTVATQALSRLSSVETYSPTPGDDPNKSLLGRCIELSKQNAIFAALYHRLYNIKDSNLETQILQTIKSANLNPIEVGYTLDKQGKGQFKVIDSTQKSTMRMLPISWSAIFFDSSLVKHSDTEITVDKNAITGIIDSYNNLVKDIFEHRLNMSDTDIDIYRNGIVELLNEVGIQVDVEAIEELLSGNRKQNLLKLVTQRNPRDVDNLGAIFNGILQNIISTKNTVPLDQIYSKKRADHIINKISSAQATASPSNNELSVLGPNNNVFYLKTQNNYCTDLVRRLNNKDQKTLNGLNNDLYCRSSLIRQTVNDGIAIKLHTFINFYGNNIGDKGREYLQTSPTEDYMLKMALTWNNYIIFPTMADKKTWNVISGCKLFNKPFKITESEDGVLNIRFDQEALDYMYMAWLDEFNSIVQYWQSLPNVKNKIKNYHTKNLGGKFRHFKGYYELVNGERKWVELNDAIDAAIKNGTVLEVLENIRKDLFTSDRIQATQDKINNNLFVQLNNELETAYELGLIDRDSTNPKRVSNRLLDSTVFQEIKSWYLNSDEKIRSNAERYAVLTMLGNHMLNTNVSKLEVEKIFTGDLAFYKNSDDQIKRLGAVLSTGDTMRTQWLTNNTELISDYRRLQARQTYTCAIFKDNEIVSHQYEQIKDMFTYANFRDLLIEKENMTEAQVDELMKDYDKAKEKYEIVYKAANKMAEDDSSAYGLNEDGTKGNINQADAAVYIRPQMYQDIVRMLGEWSDEVKQAYDILESAEDWLSNSELYRKSLNTLIKALKTTYFGYRYDENIQHNVPVFNKMAMFPMFKVLATGDNKDIYDRMNGVGKYEGLKPIDQIAFESAVKAGISGDTAFYTDYTNEKINDLTNIPTTIQEFRNLRRQLITDPHEHERGLFGTQVSTVAVANLKLDRVYGEGKPKEQQRTGEQLRDQLFGTINAISNKGALEVQEMFLTDGEIDWSKTSDVLIRAARASNMGKDFERALALNSNKDGLTIPIAALPDSKWVENTIISTTNKKAIDLELPGGAFIQMSSFGRKQIGVESSRLLNIREDGSMDAVISINLFSHVIPDYKNKSFTEAVKWLTDHNLIGDNAKPIAIGYRIPTQGLSSISALHIKDVLPANVGDMIVLPDEFTTQTGSDLLSEFDPV